MPAKRKLELDERERRTLEEMREHHPKPYLRERAAAMLKIADGMPVSQVASHGLLKWRHRDRVTEWLDRYQTEGLAGLYIRTGRGRKPAFSPRAARKRP
jgi:transposase